MQHLELHALLFANSVWVFTSQRVMNIEAGRCFETGPTAGLRRIRFVMRINSSPKCWPLITDGVFFPDNRSKRSVF